MAQVVYHSSVMASIVTVATLMMLLANAEVTCAAGGQHSATHEAPMLDDGRSPAARALDAAAGHAAIVLDAGSTGTRLQVYRLLPGSHKLVAMRGKKSRQPLSEYAASPGKAWGSLRTILGAEPGSAEESAILDGLCFEVSYTGAFDKVHTAELGEGGSARAVTSAIIASAA